jgi:outer membrane protein
MNIMKKIITTSIIFLIAAVGYGQHEFVAFGWEINFPNNSDYITKTSFAGGKIDYRHFLNKKISVGLSLNWTTYEQYLPRQTFVKPDGNSAVTSDYIAQSYQLPMTATIHYYFQESKLLKPYAGIALGGQYLDQTLYYNVYQSENSNWGFVVRPELGVIIKPGYQDWGILVAVNYSYATNKTDLINLSSFKNFGITIGVAYW